MAHYGSLVSVQTGGIREIPLDGQTVRTGIFKSPTTAVVSVETLGLEGDEQADLTVHGGPDKAVYAYPAEHYPLWRAELPDSDLPFGAFGENLTLSGFLETDVCVGDTFRVGTVLLGVSQPRVPCFKLGIRLERPTIVKEFLASGRSGFYFRVVQAGRLQVGDAVELVAREENSLTIADLSSVRFDPAADMDRLQQAVDCTGLSESWRKQLREKLESRRAGS